ncbi:capsule biosynthesis protein [Uruburuella testudinis]|uniref:Capsule biosynthesis protein n=1 Tax=Uruburuella testudinis TaxID=1282863 RepID=A0ABY4DVX3_9NEIS|nr:capsule biosynthesis protein [Uruburuella testudinis]UOO81747.1 capsule biosynthesis protein [Uruburuella testudinis]
MAKTEPIKSYLQELADTANRILLLQGPIGHFFSDLADWLQQRGKVVFKLNFNAGDTLYYPETRPNTFTYTDTFQNFPEFLAAFIAEHHIQAMVCFGDTRPYHMAAKKLADRLGNVSCWAFEEGYFRPYFITLEKCGVNAYSPLPRDAYFFTKAYPRLSEQEYRDPMPVPAGFLPVAKHAIRYYVATYLHRNRYPNYIHHRITDIGHYVKLWTLSGLKRVNYVFQDRHFAKQTENGKYGKFFILPLQVFNDSQIRMHSDFSSVRNFLLHVLTSFAAHAPADVNLIVKHHPMDRGFIDYQKDIRHFIKKHPKLKGRIFYVHDVPLPVFLRHGIGMVTLNSTSGLSALIHNMPVKVIGRAHYDIPGITFQDKLADFWVRPTPPDRDLFHAYRMYHINVTQINGSFYSRVNFPDDDNKAFRPSETRRATMQTDKAAG